MEKAVLTEQTPLAVFVRRRLEELGMKQAQFCRLTGFDQGSLSKILTSMTINLTLESVLRLSIGLCVSPKEILGLVDRMDLHEMVMMAYARELTDINGREEKDWPKPVIEICQLAYKAHNTGYGLEQVIALLCRMLMRPPASAPHRHFPPTGVEV
jgi:hypothetical protein